VFKIIHAQFLAPAIKRFVLEAPRVARKQKPGQFVILRIYEEGEPIPVTIESSDPVKGTINIVVQSAGKTTHRLNMLEGGDSVLGLSDCGGAEGGGEPDDLDCGGAQQRVGDP